MSWRSFVKATALGGILLCCQPVQAETVEEHDEEGARLYVQRQYESALREFRAAYRIEPKPRFLFNIGQCYRRLGLGPEAVEYFHRYLALEKNPDPTISAELYVYIEQIESAQDQQDKKQGKSDQPEPPPRLVDDEIVDLEELADQVVRDAKSGSKASAMELLTQIKNVWILRHDPTVFYYVARTYERMGNNSDALEYYRRYLGTEEVDSPLRNEAALQLVRLTPPAPGQKLLWPALAMGILGVAGVATGVGLFVESSKAYELYQQPLNETDKRQLRDRGQPLALGSTISYAVGGGLLGIAAIIALVAVGKGVRKKPPAILRVPIPDSTTTRRPLQSLMFNPPRLDVALSTSGGAVVLRGVF
jgi:tetratricopeptide (TPR) repeat protein